MLQIGVKTECRSNLARLALFYGNKTNHPFLNFQPVVTASPLLGMAILLQVKQVDSTVEAGAQFQQVNSSPRLHVFIGLASYITTHFCRW